MGPFSYLSFFLAPLSAERIHVAYYPLFIECKLRENRDAVLVMAPHPSPGTAPAHSSTHSYVSLMMSHVTGGALGMWQGWFPGG